MKTKRASFGFALLTIVIGFAMLALHEHAAPEPIYEGKPLSFWLDRSSGYVPTSDNEMYGYYRTKTCEALCYSGTNVFPILLHLLDAQDSKFKILLMKTLQKQHVIKIHFKSAGEQRAQGILALVLMRSAAKPALPELIKLYKKHNDSTDFYDRSFIANTFCAIGPDARDAVPVLLPDTTNSNYWVQDAAVNALKHIDPEAPTKAGLK
jgi:hypothetical protein